MRYPVDLEFPRTISRNFLAILAGSVVVGGAVGALVGLVGYAPRPESLVMIPSIALGAMIVGLVLGPLLAYVLFQGRVSNRVFYSTAAVCLVVGVIGAIVFRLLTSSQGGWLAALPAILSAIATALWFKVTGCRS